MLESKFQAELIKDIKETLPGVIVLKNDPNYIQGIPDLTVLHENGWAMLECKKEENASHRPNQDYYINMINEMHIFSAFVYPENKEEVLYALQQSFGAIR